jgi:hypothetical protein
MGRMIRFFIIIFLMSASCFGQVKQWHLTNTTANVQLQLDNRVMRVSTLADLKALPAVQVASGALVSTAGYTTAGDGGGALYRYDASSTATANDGSIILPAHGTGRYILAEPIQSFLQWGVVAGSTSAASNNAVRMQAAIVALKDGGHLILPKRSQPFFVGPRSIRPGVAVTNLVLELHGDITVPPTPTWDATHPSLFHFADAGTYNNLTIQGTATIFGNATNQTTSAGNNYGKQNCFWIGNATNILLDGLTIKGFGAFAVIMPSVDHARVSRLIIDQTLGNNDTLPGRWGANCDGVHVYDSRNVIVTECDIQSTDDCIAFTQNINSSISTNYVVSNNILRPYAGSQFIASGLRIGLETGVTNAKISHVLIANNIVRPVGANGMYIGTAAVQPSRELDQITIANNIIDGAAFNSAIQIGPSIGTNLTHNSISTGGLIVVHASGVTITGNTIYNSRSKAVLLANVGLATIRGNVISNVIDSISAQTPRGVGIYQPWGSYGNNDDVTIEGNTITGTDGGAIYGDGSSFTTAVLRVRNNVISGWLRGQYSSQGRNHAALTASRGLTNIIEGNRFVNGEGSTIVISASDTGSRHEILNNTMPMRILTPSSSVGGTEHIRVTLSGSTAGGVVRIQGNTIGGYAGRAINLENIASLTISGNQFLPDELASTVGVEMIYANYTSGSSGSGVHIVANNVAHIASKLGSNPTTFYRTLNNNGSGGSTVTLTTVVAQNIITPASGMAHVLDAFAGGARDLTYGATTTIPNSSEIPIRHRVTLTGATTLAWTNPSPGQRGQLDIYPDTVSRVVTLPSLAYSPTGATFTVNGGTGATNYTRVAWEVHQVGGTNRIFVQPTEVYR